MNKKSKKKTFEKSSFTKVLFISSHLCSPILVVSMQLSRVIAAVTCLIRATPKARQSLDKGGILTRILLKKQLNSALVSLFN